MSVTAADVVSRGLLFKTKYRIPEYNFPGGRIVGYADAGSYLGNVYSWVMYDGKLYWMFPNATGGYFYVMHIEGAYDMGGQILQIERDKAAEEEERKKEEMGALAYYVEKYGKTVLWFAAGTAIVTALIKSRKQS